MEIYDKFGNAVSSTVTLAAERQERLKKMVIELAQQTQNLTKKDIATWRRAWQVAINVENPRRNDLYRVYTDIDVDLHLSGAISQLNNSVLKKAFKVVDRKTKKEKPELTELLEAEWFKKIIKYTLDARYWGHSLIQFGDLLTVNGTKTFANIELVPRFHVSPEFGVILRDPTDEFNKGFDFRSGKIANWVLEVGGYNELGLFLKLAPPAISKKNMSAFWDQFGELFGMPIRIAKSSSSAPRDLSRVESMLNNMGAAAWGLFPEGTEIEIKESQKGDAFNVYDKRIERANSEISKGILTVTMTMDAGASLSQSKIHELMFQATVDAEADRVKDMVNNVLIPKLINFGFPFSPNDLFDWDNTIEYTPEQRTAIEQMVFSNFDVDPKYIIDTYNIPVLGKKQNPIQPNLAAEKKKLA